MFLTNELWRQILNFIFSAKDIYSMMFVCKPWYTCLCDLNWKSIYAERWKHNYNQLIDVGDIKNRKVYIPKDNMNNNYRWQFAFLWRLYLSNRTEESLDDILKKYCNRPYSSAVVSQITKKLNHLYCLNQSYFRKLEHVKSFGLPGTSYIDDTVYRQPFEGKFNPNEYYSDVNHSRIRHVANYDILPLSFQQKRGNALNTSEKVWKLIVFHPETAQPFLLVFTHFYNDRADGETLLKLTAKSFPLLLDVINFNGFRLNDPCLFSCSPHLSVSSLGCSARQLEAFLEQIKFSAKEFGIVCRIFDDLEQNVTCEEIILTTLKSQERNQHF